MPTLDDVKTALEKLEGGSALYSVVSDAIGSAKNDRQREVEALRGQHGAFLTVLRDLGYNPDQHDPNFGKTLKAELEKGKEKGEKLTREEQRLRDLETKIQESETRYQTSERLRKNAIVKELLTKQLSGKIHGANARAENLILTGEVTLGADDKSLVWRGETDINRAISTYFEANKDELVNTQSGGAGASAGNGGGNSKQMARSDFDKLSEDAKRNFLLKENGEIV